MAATAGLESRLRRLLVDASGKVGLNAAGLRKLRIHSNAVFLLPAERAVARIGGGADALARAGRAVAVTSWLSEVGFPCPTPLRVRQPLLVSDGAARVVVTFWEWVPERPDAVADAGELGRLLREMHALPRPPFALPLVRPMARFLPEVRTSPALANDDRAWLLARAEQLLAAYQELAFPLGRAAVVHGDAQTSNLLPAGDGRVLLADWDAVAAGPREWDLVVEASSDRFGTSEQERDRFARSYGFDVRSWPDWLVLRDLRELHAIGAHVRRAPDSAPHAAEMQHRINSLRSGGRERWNAVG